MKKTIKEDQKRMVLKSELLNDNTLLEYVADEGNMLVTVRFIEHSKINEHVLLNINIVDFMRNQDKIIEFNEDKSAIAIFKPTEEGYAIHNVYDTLEHEFGLIDFMDLEYEKRFNKQLIKNYFKAK